jgi:hypothetical protein
VVRFYSMVKKPTVMNGDISYAKFTAISRQVSPASLLGISASYCQIALRSSCSLYQASVFVMEENSPPKT